MEMKTPNGAAAMSGPYQSECQDVPCDTVSAMPPGAGDVVYTSRRCRNAFPIGTEARADISKMSNLRKMPRFSPFSVEKTAESQRLLFWAVWG